MSGTTRRGFAAAAASLLLTASAASAQVVLSQETFPVPTPADRALLKDVIDIHAHLDPDSYGPYSNQAERALDVVDMARRAREAGMRGFVIKQHYDQTAQLAYVTRKVAPGVEVFGMMAMNLTNGGLNPSAIRHFAEVKGGYARIVSMPTWDSANAVSRSRDPARQSVAVSRDGELLPEAKAVIAAVAAAKVRDTGATLALATGHVSAAEALMVIREANRQGVGRIVVTHAIGDPVDMTVAQMKEAAGLGAYIEFVASMTAGKQAAFTVQQYYEAIRALGPDHVILSSDSGQLNRPYPDDMIALVAGDLRAKGMTPAELRRMMVENPATLLGVPKPAGR